jgi:hypothetical protein
VDISRFGQSASTANDCFKLDRRTPKAPDPNSPSSRLATPTASEAPLNPDDVWVNTKSGKYWKPGSRYYGKTVRGEYMTEKDAVQKEYRAANGTGE